jgi:hypothetical protein
VRWPAAPAAAQAASTASRSGALHVGNRLDQPVEAGPLAGEELLDIQQHAARLGGGIADMHDEPIGVDAGGAGDVDDPPAADVDPHAA